MKRDFDRATFIFKTSNGDTALGHRALGQTEADYQDQAFQKFQSFVGTDRAFQLAIASLMYQRGAADLEVIKSGVSRNTTENLAPFFSQGFQGVESLQRISTRVLGTQPEKKLVYSLEKVFSSTTNPEFKLTISNTQKEDLFHVATEQEFILSTADTIVYHFKKNPSYNSQAPVSLDNLPVTITCTGGSIEHELAPFEGVRPPPPDTISLYEQQNLTWDQRMAIYDYENAENKYVAAKQEIQNQAMRATRLASRPLGPFTALVERTASQQSLQALREAMEQAARSVAEDPATAPFLERNVLIIEGQKSLFPSLTAAAKTVSPPSRFTFIAGRELKQITTENIKQAFTSFIDKNDDERRTLYITAAEKLFPQSITNSASQDDNNSNNIPTSSTQNQALERLNEFTNYSTSLVEAIGLLVQSPQVSISSVLLKQPHLSDPLSALATAKVDYKLEKNFHPSSTDPLLILTVNYHPTLSPKAQGNSLFSYQFDIQFVYALKTNPRWNSAKLNTLNNLPIEVRCLNIHAEQKTFFDV